MFRFLISCLASFLLAACGSPWVQLPIYRGDPKVPGSVAGIEPVGYYPAFVLRALYWYAGVQGVSVSDGVQFYRVSYWSRSDGHPTLLSGLMAFPNDRATRGTVLYMHGTKTNRADSISNPNLEEGILVGSVFASGRYLELAPDLAGLGVSHDVQPYLYNAGTADETMDFLRAAQTVVKDLGKTWNSSLFVMGFSEGGHAAALIQRELESRPDPALRVRAGAGIAGAYDLAGVELPFAMSVKSIAHSLYLENTALAYATFYHQPLDTLLKPKYASTARTLFDGDHGDELLKSLPRTPRDLFTSEFLAAYGSKQPHWFVTDLRANEAYSWKPQAPFRAYYGNRDLDVSPQDSILFAREAARRSGRVTAISVGPHDHGGTAYHAVPLVRAWFDEFTTLTAR